MRKLVAFPTKLFHLEKGFLVSKVVEGLGPYDVRELSKEQIQNKLDMLNVAFCIGCIYAKTQIEKAFNIDKEVIVTHFTNN